MAVRMELGNLLLRAGLITSEQLEDALARQVAQGGRLGDQLVAAGYLTQARLDAFLHHIPVEPETIEDTGIDETELLGLMMKQM